MARFNLSVLALCFFLAVFATALPAAQDNRPDWALHMAEEMADSTSPTPTHGSATPSVHAPASSATPSKASPSPKPSSATPKPSSSPAPPQETISGGKSKSAFDSLPVLGPLLGGLLGGGT